MVELPIRQALHSKCYNISISNHIGIQSTSPLPRLRLVLWGQVSVRCFYLGRICLSTCVRINDSDGSVFVPSGHVIRVALKCSLTNIQLCSPAPSMEHIKRLKVTPQHVSVSLVFYGCKTATDRTICPCQLDILIIV